MAHERSSTDRAHKRMNIIDPIKQAMLALGAAPVMWLMLLLSVASFAVMLERAWFFRRTRVVDIAALVTALTEQLRKRDIDAAHAVLRASASTEAAVVDAGLRELRRGATAVGEAMAGAHLLQRQRLERRLNYLGTLANNAPFIGLFGTVVGIIMAFEQLSHGHAQGSASTAVMASIAEALVTTAIGIAIAVPAVVAFNAFQKRIQIIQDQTAALGHVLIGQLEGETATRLSLLRDSRENSLLRDATHALARHSAHATNEDA